MEDAGGDKGVLVVGRSRAVLDRTAELLWERGYAAWATDDFDAITEQIDPPALDLVVFGGQVPPAEKAKMREQVEAANPEVTFIQGMSGIPGLIVDQVVGAFAGEPVLPGQAPGYDPEARAITLSLYASLEVKVTVYWITALVPPDPKSDSLRLHEGRLDPGDHRFPVPEEVSFDAAFATVRAGESIWSFRLGG